MRFGETGRGGDRLVLLSGSLVGLTLDPLASAQSKEHGLHESHPNSIKDGLKNQFEHKNLV